MELVEWKEGKMLKVSQEQALEIIQSLSSQLLNNNPNVGKKEFTLKDGDYFSISVHVEQKRHIHRYFVDTKPGIAAIRDRHHPNYDSESEMLLPNSDDVVDYVMGVFQGEGGWEIPKEDLNELLDRCIELNKEEDGQN